MYGKISVVIPALNEEKTIKRVIEKIPKNLAKATEVIVVDNASEDRTAEIARAAGATVVYEPNRGYGNAYRAGFAHATGGVIIMADADDTYPIEEAGRLLSEMEAQNADLVLGSRFRGSIEGMPLVNRIGNLLFTILINLLYGMKVSDTHSGFRAIRRKALERLELSSSGMELATEMIIKAGKKGFRIAEVPIAYREREKWLKKLRPFRDGLRHSATILKLLFSGN